MKTIENIKARAVRFIEGLFWKLGFVPADDYHKLRMVAAREIGGKAALLETLHLLDKRIMKTEHDRDRYKKRIEYLQAHFRAEQENGTWPVIYAEWVAKDEKRPDEVVCSNCGYEPPDDGGIWEVADSNTFGLENFCPYCGARMNREAGKDGAD